MLKSLLILLLVVLFSCKGKEESRESGLSLPERVVAFYNGDRYDSIFYLFSKEMKEELPIEKTKDFFSQLKKNEGAIERSEKISAKGIWVRYRVDFMNSSLWMDISQNKYGRIDGLLFTPYDGPLPGGPVTRNKTKMVLPFSGEWFVFWGGDSREQNYHVISRAQRHAFDLVIYDSAGKSYRKNGRTNEDYYAFAQPLFAPCDAKVVRVIEGVKDNLPGEMNAAQLTGNTVVLQTSHHEYLLFAHFKHNSIKVKEGDTVTKGQLLGLCGNSGNSSEPHLHFHMQDQEQMEGATGIKCFFDTLLVNGVERTDYSPVRGERIKNRQLRLRKIFPILCRFPLKSTVPNGSDFLQLTSTVMAQY